MKKILMIATGGTIASKRTDTGLAPLLSSREVLQFVPDVQKFCQVDALQLLNLTARIFGRIIGSKSQRQ